MTPLYSLVPSYILLYLLHICAHTHIYYNKTIHRWYSFEAEEGKWGANSKCFFSVHNLHSGQYKLWYISRSYGCEQFPAA